MLKKIGVGNAFCDEDNNVMTIGCTSGDDGHNTELYNKLLAFFDMIGDILQDHILAVERFIKILNLDHS